VKERQNGKRRVGSNRRRNRSAAHACRDCENYGAIPEIGGQAEHAITRIVDCISDRLSDRGLLRNPRSTSAAESACQANNASIQAQSAANKAQIDFNPACMKRDTELRLNVIEACVAHGNIPVFVNGNVDCERELK
jgi:hypothetical protein